MTITKYIQAAIEPQTEAAAITQAPKPLAPRQEDVNFNGETTVFEVTRVGGKSWHVWNGQTLEYPSSFNRTVGWVDDVTKQMKDYIKTIYSTPGVYAGASTSTTTVYAPRSTSTFTVYKTASLVEKRSATTPAPDNNSSIKTLTLDDTNTGYWGPNVKLPSGVTALTLNAGPTLSVVQKIAATPAPGKTEAMKTLTLDENFTGYWDPRLELPSGVKTITLNARESPQ